MAFPTVQTADTQYSTVGSNSSSWTLTYPTNLASGDLILAFVATDGDTSGTWTWPSGWVWTGGNSTNGANTRAYAKKLSDGTETGNFSVTLPASEQGAWRIFRITGWEGTLGTVAVGNNAATGGAIAGQGTITGSPSTTPDPPSLDPINWDTEDTLWIAVVSADTSRDITGYPSNCPDLQTKDISGGSTGASLGIAMANSATATFDPGTFTIASSDDWVTITIGIRPAGGATNTWMYAFG